MSYRQPAFTFGASGKCLVRLLCALSALTAAWSISASARANDAGTVRYGNIVNKKFATISDGPQSSLVVDVPTGTSDKDERAAIVSRLKAEWKAKAESLSSPVTRLQRSALMKKKSVVPISTLISVRRGGKLIIPPIRRTRAFGGGTLTFTYTGFADADQAFLQQFVTNAYPLLVDLYGAPASSSTVEVVNVGDLDTSTIPEVQRLAFGAYDVSSNRILLPVFDNADSFAGAFLLNIIHAFHGPAVFQYDAWEQGFARAAADAFIDKYNNAGFGFQESSANGLFSLLPYYDLLNQPALGNSTFFPPSQANISIQGQFTIGKMLPRLGMSGAAWLKVYIENPSFFSQFNAAYYAQFNSAASPSLAGNVPALRAIASSVLPSGVEGLPWDLWFEEQYILDTSVAVGNKLYAYVIPGSFDASNGQSASVTLVYYHSETTGDETLLNGTGYATYFDSTNARLTLGVSSEQASISAGEGNITTLSFPTQGVDTGRITMDFHAGSSGTRTYLANGVVGDFQAVVLGPNAAGSATVAQTTLAPVQTRTQNGTLLNAGLGVGLGTNEFELGTVVVTLNIGGIAETHRINTGDGQTFAVIRRGVTGGGVVTLNHAFNSSAVPYLVSFPLRPLQSAVDQALGLPVTDFLLSWWDTTQSVYQTFDPSQPSVEPLQMGRGYWLKVEPASLAPTVNISMTGVAPETDTDFTISCPYGWNLIGSPFNSGMDISKILIQYLQNDAISFDDAVTSSLVDTEPYLFDPTTSQYSQTNTLDGTNWTGYWLRVLVPGGVTLIMLGPDSPTSRAVESFRYVSRAPAATRAAAKPDWSVHLQAAQADRIATASLGSARDAAVKGYDNRYDREQPPAIVPALSVHFAHSDWGRAAGGRYVSDFRRVGASAATTWDFNVDTPANGTVILTWDGLGFVPNRTKLTLVDKASGTRTALRSRSAYTFSGTAGTTRAFQIIAEPDRSTPLSISGLVATPLRSVSGGGRSVNVSYNLSAAADVSVEMSSLSGRLKRTINTGRAAASGRQSVHWDGRAQDGSALPPGPYTLTITARDDDGTVARVSQPVMLLQ